jgi:hypothetical protein
MAVAKPQSTIHMEPNFEKRLRELQQHAALEVARRSLGQQVPWHRPAGWNGDPTDVEGLSAPFDRSVANQCAVDAIKDKDKPGTVGDVVAATTMIDYLATMERAFRVRHTMRRPRAVAHALARMKYQADPFGPFIQGGVEYARELIKRAKEPPP